MTSPVFKLLPIKDVVERHGLTHLYSYAYGLKEEPARPVAVWEGDITLDSLSLDWPDAESQRDADIFGYLVIGNLTVTKHITCTETDGGLGLVVLGDLRAGNIAVGGQELYVRGNVTVDEVYCGSYNHGESIIDGDVSAKLLISDDYRFWIKGRLLAPTAGDCCERIGLLEGRDLDIDFDYENDDSGLGYCGARWVDGEVPINFALVEDCFDDEQDECQFMFYALVERILAGQPVLNPDCDPRSPEVAAWREANALFSAGYEAHFEDEDEERAIELFQQALAAGFSEKRCRYMLGLSLYGVELNEGNRYPEAIENFTYCIDHDYEREESLVKRASSRLLSLSGDNDDAAHAAAQADCDEAIQTAYGHFLAEAHNLKGYSLYLQGRYADAIAPLAASLAVDDENYNANYNMARCLWLLDREAEALPYADQAIDIDADEDFLHCIKAHCHYAAGEYEAASRSYKRYLKKDTDDLLARGHQIASLIALNRLDEAHREASRLIQLHPGQATINADGYLAEALWQADREPEAMPYATQAVASAPDSDYLHCIKAHCHYGAGEYEAACQGYERYLKSDSDYELAWHNLVLSLVALNRLDDAHRQAVQMFALHPEQQTVNPDGFMAWALWLGEREEEGLPYAIRSAELHPAPGYHLLVKGACHAQLGQINAAFADWNVYSRFAPEDINVWNLAAEVYLLIGEMKLAEQCIATAVAIDPENDETCQLKNEYEKRMAAQG